MAAPTRPSAQQPADPSVGPPSGPTVEAVPGAQAVAVPGAPAEVEQVAAGGSAARDTWRAFRRQPLGVLSLGVLGVLVAVAVLAPLLADYPSGTGSSVLAPPSAQHWFGTDNLGRDVFAQVVWGSRSSLLVAAGASALAIVLGTAVAVAGAWWPRLDALVGLVVDLVLSLPVLPLMILVAALVGPSTTTIVLVIAAFSWPEVTRVVRSLALTVVRLPYMDAARLLTPSATWIITRHLLPAVTPVVVVSVVLTASRAVLSAAGLAFLGLGDPRSWSWGRVLFEAQQAGAMSSAWWLTLFPSLAILALVLAATLASIAFNDARDPRSRVRR
ncbi:ABC transporter permease [Pseudokineococcus marinus]|uniref:ABC transporter permease n=1 Tax=Pseudokineococcus marinus TaxID=351215 RepID=A0A849BKQ7_9ACTN|nr:ABC transporter permease [Pseudokineococcus marinus]NNH21925.1 ABC transporter permease [Pseudokineococcus marinus]